jgi:hypothetical protein
MTDTPAGHCPAGHEITWASGSTTSYSTCPDCPVNVDGRGHFTLWCEPCRLRYYPRGCLRGATP